MLMHSRRGLRHRYGKRAIGCASELLLIWKENKSRGAASIAAGTKWDGKYMSDPLATMNSPELTTHYRVGLLLVTLSAVAWSTAGFFTRLIPLDAWTTLFWRGIFGALTGIAFLLVMERANPLLVFARIGWTGLLFSLLSTAGMAAFLGALKTTVAHVAIIYALVPFLAAGLPGSP
jgi:hypothetical protein